MTGNISKEELDLLEEIIEEPVGEYLFRPHELTILRKLIRKGLIKVGYMYGIRTYFMYDAEEKYQSDCKSCGKSHSFCILYGNSLVYFCKDCKTRNQINREILTELKKNYDW